MGAWGYTTWESDTALDYLGDHIEELKRDIEKDLESALSGKDSVIDRPVLAAVAMLRALLRGCDRHSTLARSKAKAWRDQYLAWFDRPDVTACHKNPHLFRQEAVKEFRRLIAAASDDSDTEELEKELDEEHQRQEAQKKKSRKKPKRG